MHLLFFFLISLASKMRKHLSFRRKKKFSSDSQLRCSSWKKNWWIRCFKRLGEVGGQKIIERNRCKINLSDEKKNDCITMLPQAGKLERLSPDLNGTQVMLTTHVKGSEYSRKCEWQKKTDDISLSKWYSASPFSWLCQLARPRNQKRTLTICLLGWSWDRDFRGRCATKVSWIFWKVQILIFTSRLTTLFGRVPTVNIKGYFSLTFCIRFSLAALEDWNWSGWESIKLLPQVFTVLAEEVTQYSIIIFYIFVQTCIFLVRRDLLQVPICTFWVKNR